jgi:hypothetical protein
MATMGVTESPSPTPDPLIGISHQPDSRDIEWQVPYIGDQPWEGPQNLLPLLTGPAVPTCRRRV